MKDKTLHALADKIDRVLGPVFADGVEIRAVRVERSFLTAEPARWKGERTALAFGSRLSDEHNRLIGTVVDDAL